MSKNQDIEALRAYAILITFIAHLGSMVPSWIPWLAYFWLGGGVDLFFCISGFVITRSLASEGRRTRDGSFAHFAVPFWTRRVFRLWPAALVCSAVTIGLAVGFNQSGAFGHSDEIALTALAGMFQLVNLRLVACLHHYALTCNGDSLWHYWSLSLEEQFYFVFPFLVFFLPRKWLFTVLVLAVLSQTFLERPWPSALWFWRTDAIMLGILLAYFEPTKHFRQLRSLACLHRRATRSLSTLACVLLIVLATPKVAFFYHGIMAVVAACIVLIAAFDDRLTLPVQRWHPALAYIGSRSYSIYLTHLPAFAAARELVFRFAGPGPQTALTVIIGLVITAIASEASYRWIEMPARAYGRRVAAVSHRRGALILQGQAETAAAEAL